MRKLLETLCFICAALTLLSALIIGRMLPPGTQELVQEKYASWSGVLRIWVYEGWTGGSDAFAGWLNRCIASYEKQHNGVYVQAKYVDAAAILALETSGVRPPDMLLFPPGLLADPSALAALPELPVRSTLAQAGEGRAVPVALGGYAWAYNPSLIEEASPFTLAALPDEDFRSWSAALMSLCAAAPSGQEPEAIELPGVELGLPTGGFDTSSLIIEETALSKFIAGEAAAAAVSQREIVRLQQLSEQGKGPDWAIEVSALPFTDQLLMLGVVESNTERQALSVKFAQHLLTDECQSLLTHAGAFSVTDAPSGYSAADPLAKLDLALRRPTLTVPSAFGSGWRTICAQLLRGAGHDPNNIPELPKALFGENVL